MEIQEVMRYLGYRKNSYDEATLNRAREIMREVEGAIRPKWHFQQADILERKPESLVLKAGSIVLKGKSITKHLADASRVYMLCATLGVESERMLMRFQARSMTDSMILDACLSAYVEEAADACQAAIRNEIREDEDLTFRFSPGYGDLPLAVQKDMIGFNRWDRILGVTLTKSMMMVPGKSVIAVIGVETMKKDKKKTMQPCGNATCQGCSLKDQCNWKKGMVDHE
jgi:hypothetical protein